MKNITNTIFMALAFVAVVFAESAPTQNSAATRRQPQTANVNRPKPAAVAGKVQKPTIGKGVIALPSMSSLTNAASRDLSVLFTNRTRKAKTAVDTSAYKPGDVVLRCYDDVLVWSNLVVYADLQALFSPVVVPPNATENQVKQIMVAARNRRYEILVNNYLKNAVLAHVARTNGLVVTQAELYSALSNAVKKVVGRHRDQVVPKLMVPGSYFYNNQRNFLLSKKYVGKIFAQDGACSSVELEKIKQQRERDIQAAIATNALLRPKIEGFLTEIKSGKRTFEEIEWKESEDAADNGVLGEFEPDCSLLKPLKDFIFAPSEKVLSDVIETPYSYHIVKILGRKYDCDERDEDDESKVPDRTSAPSNIIPILTVFGVFVVVGCVVLWFCLPKTGSIRRWLPASVLLGGVVVGVVVYANRTIPAPSKVKVAHILLEKTPVPAHLDDEGARLELTRTRIGKHTMMCQANELKAGMKSGQIKSKFKITLLHRLERAEQAKQKKPLNQKTPNRKKEGK